MQRRNAIALLITIMFVMIISVAIGYELMQVKKATDIVRSENYLYEDNMLLDDVLNILKTSPELLRLADNNSSDDLYIFLQTYSFLPLELKDAKLLISLKSARSKLNINSLNKTNEALFRQYFNILMVGDDYVDVLKECMRKNQAPNEYNNYTSALFDANPTLFRDYIASQRHLKMLNAFYKREYGDENLKNVPFEKLFSYGAYANEAVDANYLTSEIWQLMLDVSKERAEELVAAEGSYKTVADLHLSTQEVQNFQKFKTTFFAPYLLVEVSIVREKSVSKIRFIYDIKSKRGYDFVFKV